MPPNRSPPQQSLDPCLFEPEVLMTSGGLQTALDSIKRVCYHDDSLITGVITELSSRPHIFEYIISSTFFLCSLDSFGFYYLHILLQAWTTGPSRAYRSGLLPSSLRLERSISWGPWALNSSSDFPLP
jgi:hypothetical protein